MAGHTLLLNLVGGIALLIWATRLVRRSVLKAFGMRLREAIGHATAGRLRACGTGIVVATALQSSSATGLLVTSFAERGLLALAPALAIMLGADLGSTLVVQALSFKVAALVPVLLILGVALAGMAKSTIGRESGRILIGLALMIVSLGMIVQASEPLRQNDVFVLVMERLGDDPILAFVIGAALTWLVHSSVAIVLLIASLAAAGVLGAPAALAFVLGANVGSGLIPLGFAFRSHGVAKHVLLGNFAFRLVGALAALVLISYGRDLAAWLGADAGRQVANFHAAFNGVLALLFLPFVDHVARLLERFVPDQKAGPERRVTYLDDSDLDRPAAAIGNATREVIRLADTVEQMLRDAILAFRSGNENLRTETSHLDNEVDRLQEAVKLYLTRLTRQSLDDEDARRCVDLILFTTNLEHVGDIIDRGLLALAAKREREGVAFSDAGWAEIMALHARVVEQMRLAVSVFVTRDLAMARALVAEKDAIRAAERAATESHFQRLRDGTVASIETSSLHLDILRDLKRIAAHLTSVALPILEANGALRTSRLVAEG